MYHLPLLRAGRPYRSLAVAPVCHIQTGVLLAEVSQANSGLIAKDLQAAPANKRALDVLPVRELLDIAGKAADIFLNDDLPLGDAVQSPDEYVRLLSGSTGMPEVLCRQNMQKIALVAREMESILGGLTRGLDLSILDEGWGLHEERPLSYLCRSDTLGAVLPSNSPGVHSLWLPAIPLKIPLILKPGGEEPWTPYRIAQAFMAAGCPPEAFSYYPTDHAGAGEILLHCGRSMLFGGESTVAPWKSDPRVQIHGPGQSKIILDTASAAEWERYLDVMVSSIADNGGRSCINASSIWTPAHGRDIADALAQRLAPITARPLDDPDARIAAFANPRLAEQLSALIDRQLKIPGAIDLTKELRGRDRLETLDGCTYLAPTVIWCDDPTHPLANTEFLFPFVSVVEAPQEEILDRIGSTLTATVLTRDPVFLKKMMTAPGIDRLNVGSIPTNHVSWDQPHEGNLFEHLYQQRAFQWTPGEGECALPRVHRGPALHNADPLVDA